MLTPVPKPWSGVSRDFRLFRTADRLEHGVFEKQVDQIMPTAGVINIIVTIPDDAQLLASHVANRVAGVLSADGSHGWHAVEKVVLDTMETLAAGHGLGKADHHHVAAAHSGRFHAHPSHVPEDLLAEYLLTGKVALHDSGGAVRVDDGKRKYVAYAQPGHAKESKKTLDQLHGHFILAVRPLLDHLEGKVLVA
jgi:hypothetical protein